MNKKNYDRSSSGCYKGKTISDILGKGWMMKGRKRVRSGRLNKLYKDTRKCNYSLQVTSLAHKLLSEASDVLDATYNDTIISALSATSDEELKKSFKELTKKVKE